MKNVLKLILFFCVVVALGMILTLLVYKFLPFSFSKIFRRIVMVIAIAGIPFLWTKIFKKSFKNIGLSPSISWNKNVIFGATVGITSFVVMIGFAFLIGKIKLNDGLTFSKIFLTLAPFLAASILVGFLEEVFFRGMIFRLLNETMKQNWAIVISSAFYSSVHFLKPTDEPLKVILRAIGLFIVGVILTRSFIRTKTLYFSIGLHASWVFAIRAYKLLFCYEYTQSELIFWGDTIFLSGIIGWSYLILLCIIMDKIILPNKETL